MKNTCMASNRLNFIGNLRYAITILMLPISLLSQDTIRVKLAASHFSNDGSPALDFSRILLNKLVKPSEYIIIPSESENDSVDLIGPCEIDLKATPQGFSKSTGVFISSNVIVSTSNRNIASLNEISESRIGVIFSSRAEERIRQETQFFKTYSSTNNLFLDLISDRIDYAVLEASIAKSILSRSTDQFRLYVANDNIFKSNLGFFVRSNNQKLQNYLNERIEGFKNSQDAKEIATRFIILPKDYGRIILILGLSFGLILLLGFVFLGWKRGWSKRLANFYKVEMNGLLMIRPSPTARPSPSDDENRLSFREKFSKLQTRYPSIQVRLDFQPTAVKIEFRSVGKMRVQGKEFLDTFAADLEDLLSAFAPDKYLIELNIIGECSNSFELNKLVFTNNGNKVGVMVTEFKKRFSI